MNRLAVLLSLLLGLAVCCPAQSSDLPGAWIPVKLRWAPSEDFGMVAEAKVLYFVADGSLAIINGTISETPGKLEVAPDWQTVFTGHWHRRAKRVTVTYELSWSWIERDGPKKEYQDVLSVTKAGTLLYAGVEYRLEPSLDKSALHNITVLVPSFAAGQNKDKCTAHDDLRLEVLSSRPLTARELRKLLSDEIVLGARTLVRLRLSAPRESSVFVYVWKGVEPLGYKVKLTGEIKTWLYYREPRKGASSTSPGIKPLTDGFDGAWLSMSPGTAIEWDSIDNGSRGDRHAATVFIKRGESSTPVEIFSEPYTIKDGSASEQRSERREK